MVKWIPIQLFFRACFGVPESSLSNITSGFLLRKVIWLLLLTQLYLYTHRDASCASKDKCWVVNSTKMTFLMSSIIIQLSSRMNNGQFVTFLSYPSIRGSQFDPPRKQREGRLKSSTTTTAFSIFIFYCEKKKCSTVLARLRFSSIFGNWHLSIQKFFLIIHGKYNLVVAMGLRSSVPIIEKN